MKIFKGKTILLKIGLFLLIFAIFLSICLFRIDPDFGWHLRTGQLILQGWQIPHIDWYSFTMSNFPWIAHEWLTDIFAYLLYSAFGYYLLAFISALISSLAIYTAVSIKKIKYSFIPGTLGALALLPFIGVRPQILTILFLALIYFLIRKFLWLPKNKHNLIILFLLPLIFIIWANLHGGFIIGLFLLLLLLIVRLFHYFCDNSKDKFFPYDILLILPICILASFINPYGPYIYREIFSTIFDSFLKFHINEWLPIFFSSSLFIIIYLGTFTGLLICLYKEFDFFDDLFIPLVFLLLGTFSSRNFALFVIISIPLLADFIRVTSQKANKKKKDYLKNILKSPVTICILSIVFLLIIVFNVIQGRTSKNSYPWKAVAYLVSHPIQGNIFNVYDWGGFLIWQMPENKVFIDGRMPSWRNNSEYVFKDYINMEEGADNCQSLLKKYDIEYALVKKNKPENNTINKWLAQTFNYQASNKNFKEIFINSGYKVVYQDDTAVILKKAD